MSHLRFDPLASSAPLIVYIDYKSTYAYLAKDPTYALVDEFGIEVDWRPFTLDIPSYLGSARLNDQGRVVDNQRSGGQWTRVKYAYHDARRYGAPRGLVVRGTSKTWDSSLAGIGMLWAKAQSERVLHAYSDRVYNRFWKRELDIEDLAAIEGILTDSGANSAGFQAYAAGAGRALHDDIQRAAFDAGIFGVPTYVVGGERLFGREHLPRVRWLLTGRHGPPPDVAYEDVAARHATVDALMHSALSVVIDFKNPYSYLALGPTCALTNELGIVTDWLPFLVSPWRKRSPSPGDDRGACHRRYRAEYAESEVLRYAAARGLTLRGLYRESDATLPGIGLLWTKRSRASMTQAYVQRVCEQYWREELDLEDHGAIRQLLEQIGVPVRGFDTFVNHDGLAEIERVQSELREAGIFDVPAYRLGSDVYMGRQHLPVLRSLLARRRGQP